MKSKVIVLTLVLSLIFATACFASEILPGTIGLNSRPGEAMLKNRTADQFFEMIKRMEGPGGVFGKNADVKAVTPNGTVTEVSASNGIDVHMVKNTEWGGAVMLSASSYGVGNGKISATTTTSTTGGSVTTSTTGNLYGIYGMNSYNGAISSGACYPEMVAGIWGNPPYATYLYYAKRRFVDRYTSTTPIPGDATVETNSLHSGNKNFISNGYMFNRDMFGYYYYDASTRAGYASPYTTTRLVVWVAPTTSGI